MKTEKKKWRDLALVAEFWFVMLLTVGTFLYGAWQAGRGSLVLRRARQVQPVPTPNVP